MPSSNSVALITKDAELTYDELGALSRRLVEPLPERAVVFLQASNSIEAVAFYCGCIEKGVVPLMMGKEPGSEAWQMLEEEYLPQFAWVKEGAIAGGAVVSAYGGYELVRLRECSPALHPDLALLLSTSGSTGSPKLVKLTRKNLHENARSIAEYLGIRAGDKAITTLPFNYSYGISIVNSHLLAGASLILTDESLMSRDFWTLLKEKEATTFGGVPYTYQMLKRLRFFHMELPSLRYLTQAGGRLGEELHEEFGRLCAEKGIGFCVMYGQTEATARMSYLPPERCLDKVGSIGIAIPGGEFSLAGEAGEALDGADVEGELVYRGPNVSMGYATCVEELSTGDERNGLLHTGDMARRDDDGYYYITGRKGRFLKVYGNRVGLDELEQLLAKAGYTAAATGVDDHVELYVENADEAAAIAAAAEATSLHPSAFAAIRLERLPRNAAGKIQYSQLKAGE